MRGLILVTPYDADTRAINLVTGRHGFGHAALACSEYDAFDRPLAIDASFATGKIQRRIVRRVTRGRPWILLPIPNIEDVYARALERVGQPYNNWGLLGRQRPGKAATCSQLVYECLNEPDLVPCWRKGWCSPNDLYRAFGGERGRCEGGG